jgi:hypothetical protein
MNLNLNSNTLAPDLESQKQRYLQRVNQLYTNIQHWLQNQPLRIHVSDLEIEEVLGRYHVPQLAIATTQGDTLAKFQPEGASVVGAEGLIMVRGWLNGEYVLYLQKEGYYSISQGIQEDGWYWDPQYMDKPPHPLNPTWLLKLITQVSDYEFPESVTASQASL